MKLLRWLWIVAVLAAVVAAGHAFLQSRETARLKAQRLQIVTEPDAVTVFRLKNDNPVRSFAECKIVGKGHTPTGDELQRLVALLKPYVADADYRPINVACTPDPGVAIVFKKGDKKVEIMLCYFCYLLHVERESKSQWQSFMQDRAAMNAIAKFCFPNDKEIQSLKNDPTE